MKEKNFGELNVGDKIYAFNLNKVDNRIIKDIIIDSIDYTSCVPFNICGYVCFCDVIEKDGIIYATSKQSILKYLEDRLSMLKSNISYYERENRLLEEQIIKINKEIEEYNHKKREILSFIARLKDRYYL